MAVFLNLRNNIFFLGGGGYQCIHVLNSFFKHFI